MGRLDVVLVSMFAFLCAVGGARLACCNFSWLHTQWWFSLVPDAIIRGQCALARANVVTCGVKTHSFKFLFFCCAATHHETRAASLRQASAKIFRTVSM